MRVPLSLVLLYQLRRSDGDEIRDLQKASFDTFLLAGSISSIAQLERARVATLGFDWWFAEDEDLLP
jgi:hypothetical protein